MKRYKTVTNLLQDSPHPDPVSCDNQSVKFQITGSRKTQDNRARNLRTESSNKNQYKWIDDIWMTAKRTQNSHEKAHHLEWI